MDILKGKKKVLEYALIERFVDEVHRLLERKDKVVFAICGGRNVGEIFDLIDLMTYFRQDIRIPWDKIHVVMVDERLVSLKDPESNYALAYEHIFADLVNRKLLPKTNLHPFKYQPRKKDLGIKDYNATLKQLGGKFDIVLLSAGEDGHVAGLYPNHTIKTPGKKFFAFHDSPKPPQDRMSASRKLIETAQVAFTVFFGKEKRAAFKKIPESRNGGSLPCKTRQKHQTLLCVCNEVGYKHNP